MVLDAAKLTGTNFVDGHYHLKCQLDKKYTMCVCREITDNLIRRLCRDGAGKLTGLRAKFAVASACGRCGILAQTIVKKFHKTGSFTSAA